MDPIFVAKPMLPDRRNVHDYIDRIWKSGLVTNEGPLHNELENRLKVLLDVPVAKLFCNGMTAMLAGLHVFGFKPGAEIITTPLTFAATPHAIALGGFKPVFADVAPDTLTLDPEAVERAITPNTAAIYAVHVYGTICDNAGLMAVCRKHGLKLLYDAAHAFGVTVDGAPVGTMGDATTFSLHATKLYNTLEGGLLTAPDGDLAQRFRLLRNFGIVDEATVSDIGFNGKMSEVHAAIGLLNLDIYETERTFRRNLRANYDSIVSDIDGVRPQVKQPGVVSSEQYYLLVIDEKVHGRSREDIYNALKERGIHTRRYFWPICTDFEPYKDYPIYSTRNRPVVEAVKNSLLCLPFHSGVQDVHINAIAEELRRR
jgi:dTDP-4-amino-4,6-dideoxygalactose transaminase